MMNTDASCDEDYIYPCANMSKDKKMSQHSTVQSYSFKKKPTQKQLCD